MRQASFASSSVHGGGKRREEDIHLLQGNACFSARTTRLPGMPRRRVRVRVPQHPLVARSIRHRSRNVE